MLNVKKRIFGIIVLIVFLLSTATIATQNVTFEPEFSALEVEFPKHFAGFQSTNFDDIKVMRPLKVSQPHPVYKSALEKISQTLKSHSKIFSPILQDVDKMLQASNGFTRLQYLFVLTRIGVLDARGSDEEEQFFRGTGFPQPYSRMRQSKFVNGLNTFEEFLTFLGDDEGWDSDKYESFERITTRRYEDRGNTVEERHVKKGPFSRFVYPLIGQDELGFFYLAWTYYQGVHPVPFPLEENLCDLHGIQMSRLGKTCHDWAHSDLDTSDYNAEQFSYYLISYYADLIKLISKDLKPDERRKWSVRAMLPHICEFVMSVHNLYRQSLLDILKLSLQMLDPRCNENLAEFEAFSVGSFVHAHEASANLSQEYGAPVLSELLIASVAKSRSKGEKEKKIDSGKDVISVQENGNVTNNLFKTSFVTGESPLSDEEIFNLVKVLDKSKFLARGYVSIYGMEKIDLDEIEDYKVYRNKFYIDVQIFMIGDIDFYVFRQSTNYSNQLNFVHDGTILRPALKVLARAHNYALPSFPIANHFQSDAEYDSAAITCQIELDKGKGYLMDNWLKTAIRLSEVSDQCQPLSIAERYKAGYESAFKKLAGIIPPQLGNLQHHIKMAVHPDILSGKIKPGLYPEQAASSAAVIPEIVPVEATRAQSQNDK